MAKGISKRKAEEIASRGLKGKIALAAGTAYHNYIAYGAQRTIEVFREFYDLWKLCNSKDFAQGTGVFENYFFSGKNFNYKAIDLLLAENNEVTSPVWAMHGVEEMHTLVNRKGENIYNKKIQNPDWKHNFSENPMAFHANPEVNKAILDFMEVMIPEKFRYSEGSLENLADAIKYARAKNLNINFIANHEGNLDAWTWEYLMKDLVDLGYLSPDDARWFMCGVWMMVNNSTRQHAVGTNNLAVYGLSDLDHLRERSKKKSTHHYSESEMEQRRNDYILSKKFSFDQFVNPRRELGILYTYGSRGDFAGIKEDLSRTMQGYFHATGQIYIPTHVARTSDSMPLGNGAIGWYKHFKSQPFLEVDIGKFFVSGEKTISEIHKMSVNQAYKMQPERMGFEEPVRAYKRLNTLKDTAINGQVTEELLAKIQTAQDELTHILTNTEMGEKTRHYIENFF